jgi:hypothetical protein
MTNNGHPILQQRISLEISYFNKFVTPATSIAIPFGHTIDFDHVIAPLGATISFSVGSYQTLCKEDNTTQFSLTRSLTPSILDVIPPNIRNGKKIRFKY